MPFPLNICNCHLFHGVYLDVHYDVPSAVIGKKVLIVRIIVIVTIVVTERVIVNHIFNHVITKYSLIINHLLLFAVHQRLGLNC